MDKHFVDTCTIAVGPATGTVFAISSLGFTINALYDTGTTKSCMSLKTFGRNSDWNKHGTNGVH